MEEEEEDDEEEEEVWVGRKRAERCIHTQGHKARSRCTFLRALSSGGFGMGVSADMWSEADGFECIVSCGRDDDDDDRVVCVCVCVSVCVCVCV